MPLIERRTLAGFLVGALTAGVAASAGAAAAWNTGPRAATAAAAVATTTATTTVKACFNKRTGQLFYTGTGSKRRKCRKGEKALTWSVRGPAGPTAPTDAKGTLHLESDNGQFVIDVSNFGIVLHGPGSSLTIDRRGIHQQAPFGQVGP